MEHELCWSYNRWLTEKVLPESNGRFYSMLSLPFNDPDEALRQVETFGDRKHVGGFMVTAVRSHMAVNDNAYMKVYRAIEERGLVLRSTPARTGASRSSRAATASCPCMRSASRGTTCCITNWVINGMGERFQAAGGLDRGQGSPGSHS
jgi:predicted TIM-barrel fold metal-dependent hydrolase